MRLNPFNVKRLNLLTRVTPVTPQTPHWRGAAIAIGVLSSFGAIAAIAPAAQAQPSQGAECGQVLRLAEDTGDQLGNLFRNASDPAQLFGNVATITETAAASYAAMALADPQLQEYQSGFVTVYTAISAVSQRLYDAEQAGDTAAAQAAFQDFQTAVRPEGALIDATIDYCIGGSDTPTTYDSDDSSATD